MKRIVSLLFLFTVIALMTVSTAPDILYAQNGTAGAGTSAAPDDTGSNGNGSQGGEESVDAGETDTDAPEEGEDASEGEDDGEDSGDSEDEDTDESETEDYYLQVTPKNVRIAVGETVQFSAEIVAVEDEEAEENDAEDGDEETDDGESEEGDSEEDGEDDGSVPAEKAADVAVSWSVSDPSLGEIDENGLFTALAAGKVKVIAETEDLKGQTNVTISDTGDETPGNGTSGTVNEIAFYRQLRNGNVTKHGSPVNENGTKTLSGLPNPLNILNGTKIYIPEDALNENISITVKLPAFTKTNSDDEAEFDGSIINAITFEVTVDGEVVSPYYFDEPLEVSIPFKTGKMEKLGLSAEDLSMYFANDLGDISVDAGISGIAVNERNGELTGRVAHFSTIIIAPKEGVADNSGSGGDGTGNDDAGNDDAGQGTDDDEEPGNSDDGSGQNGEATDNGEQNGSSDEAEGPALKVFPKRVIAEIGETIKFEAEIITDDDIEDEGTEEDEIEEAKDEEGEAAKIAADVVITWSISDESVGTIDDEGLFTAVALGKITITATADTLKGTARVEVTEDGPKTEPGVNTISMFRTLPNGNTTKYGSRTSENDEITLGGLPFPLNVLNGTKMTIPENSLTEDIDLNVVIPPFAEVKDAEENVDFGKRIVAGVKFEVRAGGELISPYYFDEPLEVVIPFKRGLLDKLGITPEDLGMYFANADGEIDPEDPGITDIVVDEASNTITGRVAHFSNIVVAPKDAVPTFVSNSEDFKPGVVELMQNAPNPFNPTTTISFRITSSSHISLAIYNMLGQEVKTLAEGSFQPGNYSMIWNADDNSGNAVTSGIYFYRLKTENVTKTKKLMLLK